MPSPNKKFLYDVRVDRPNPFFARILRLGLTGIEGKTRICLQYLMQAWNKRGPSKYRDAVLEIGEEEMEHAEIYAKAIALNVEGSSTKVQKVAAEANPMIAVAMNDLRVQGHQFDPVSTEVPNFEGLMFGGSVFSYHGDFTADTIANADAETKSITLAHRLNEMTDDPGMKDMFRHLIARDAAHREQWLIMLEEFGSLRKQLSAPTYNVKPQQFIVGSNKNRA